MPYNSETSADKIVNVLSDTRTNTDIVAECLVRTPFATQQKLFHLICQYIYRQAMCYDYGAFVNNTDEIAFIAKRIRDEVLIHHQPEPSGGIVKVPPLWS